jgi:hypothetical protein
MCWSYEMNGFAGFKIATGNILVAELPDILSIVFCQFRVFAVSILESVLVLNQSATQNR